MRLIRTLVFVPLYGLLLTAPLDAAELEQSEVRRVTVRSRGLEATGSSHYAELSSDGRLVVFTSVATDLVPGDDNGAYDVFCVDRKTSTLTRESIGLLSFNPVIDTVNANGGSFNPTITADGRFICFGTDATNVANDGVSDSNGVRDVVLRDREQFKTILCSRASDGTLSNGISASPRVAANGRFVTYVSLASNLVPSDGNGVYDVFVHDAKTRVTERVSVDKVGGDPNGISSVPDISANGRFVTFQSMATDLTDGDVNSALDIYVRDRKTGQTLLASRTPEGTAGDSHSSWASISENGRYVVFESDATNLVAGDTNGKKDVFRFDRKTKTVILVSRPAAGGASNGDNSSATISKSGRYVAFASLASNLVQGDGNGAKDVFVADLKKGALTRVGGAGTSDRPTLSASGQVLAFDSTAGDLVSDDANSVGDVFAMNRKTNEVTRLSLSKGLDEQNGDGNATCVSPTGRYVGFGSHGTNLAGSDQNGFEDAYLRDTLTGTTERLSFDWLDGEPNGDCTPVSISKDAKFVLIIADASDLVPGDDNGQADLFRLERATGEMIHVTAAFNGSFPGGVVSTGSMSADGRYVAFGHVAEDLVPGDNNGLSDVFVRDIDAGVTTLISIGKDGVASDGLSFTPRLSSDGRYAVFSSGATNLVDGDTNGLDDCFRRDLKTGKTTRVSIRKDGVEPNGYSSIPFVSKNGRFVAFRSAASNFAAIDTNLAPDVFIKDMKTGKLTLASRTPSGSAGNAISISGTISDDGRFIAISSGASDLVAGDTNAKADIFLFDRKKGSMTRISTGLYGTGNTSGSTGGWVSPNGKFVMFSSASDDIVLADDNASWDGFLYRR